MIEKLKYLERADIPMRVVETLTAEETTDWLIQYHGLHESSRQTVERALRQQFGWHNLRGRLQRSPFVAAIVELWLRVKGIQW